MSETIYVSEGGSRLDKYLTGILSLNRSQIKNAILEGRILVDGVQKKAGYTLSAGECISYEEATPYRLEGKDLGVRVLYEDDDLALVEKLYGMVVHPGAAREEDTLVHHLLWRFSSLAEGSDPLRPGIVHRLDKDTSGIMAIAKTDRAYTGLVELFSARKIRKEYYALCRGNIREPGRIDAPIGRDPAQRTRMACDVYPSKEALTAYTPVRAFGEASLLRVRIYTGRTHQIRVHMRHIGHPVVGDPIYGIHADRKGKLMLHSYRLSFTHPITQARIDGRSKLPRRFIAYFRKHGGERCTGF